MGLGIKWTVHEVKLPGSHIACVYEIQGPHVLNEGVNPPTFFLHKEDALKMAASRELFEACQSLLSISIDPCVTAPEQRLEVKEARAAIAQAEGRPS